MRQNVGVALAVGVAILLVVQDALAHEPVRTVNADTDGSIELSRIRPPAQPERYEDVTIQFPDGAELRVRLKSISRKGPPFPQPNRLTERLDALVNLAESGDGPSAAALWKWLRKCEKAYSDEQSLKAAISQLRTKRIVMYPEGTASPLPLGPNDDIAEVERFELVDPFEFCAGITHEQKAASKRWRKVALEAGDYPTVTEWASSLGNTPESVKAWEYIWNLGYRGALSPLAIRAAAGAKDGKPDMVSSYAYALADYELFDAAFGQSGNAGHQKMLGALKDNLQRKLSKLTPPQADEAVKKARTLIQENVNCCYGAW